MERGNEKILIHIGLDKCGSTAIQASFKRNQAAFDAAGVVYPTTGKLCGHHVSLANLFGFGFVKIEEEHAEELRSCLEAEIKNARTVVLSSEHFSYACSEEGIRKLAAFCSGFEVRIVLVLRNQIDWLEAQYSETIKWGNQQTFEDFLAENVDGADYSELLRQWEACFDGRIKLLIFDAEPEELVLRFHQLVGTADLSPPQKKKHNVSPSAVVMEIIRKVNSLNRQSEVSQETYDNLKRIQSDIMAIADREKTVGSNFKWSSQAVARLREFEAGNQAIAKKYLGKKDLFPESMGAYIHRNVSDEKNIDNSQAADQ